MTPTDPQHERGPADDAPADDRPTDEAVASRSDLLPEEKAAGSEDPEAQAEAVLADSLERTEDPEGTRADSTQTPG